MLAGSPDTASTSSVLSCVAGGIRASGALVSDDEASSTAFEPAHPMTERSTTVNTK